MLNINNNLTLKTKQRIIFNYNKIWKNEKVANK